MVVVLSLVVQISALDSRKRKKEYVDGLETRLVAAAIATAAV